METRICTICKYPISHDQIVTSAGDGYAHPQCFHILRPAMMALNEILDGIDIIQAYEWYPGSREKREARFTAKQVEELRQAYLCVRRKQRSLQALIGE